MSTRVSVTTSDGFGIDAQTSGQKRGRTLLLLAGQANSHRWWTSVRDDFEDLFRVVSLDQRGTGASRGEVTDWSTDLFADDARDVLAAVGARSAVVYGTSMGGRVAQSLAIRHPGAVEGLVLACSSSGGPHAQERGVEVRLALAEPDPGRRLAALQRLFYTDSWPYPPEHSHLFGDPTMSKDETRAHLRASSRHDAWDELAGIVAPTLVLHGTDDRMAPVANAHLLAERIPSARLHLVEGGRHGFFEEYRDEVVPLIRAFAS